MTRQTPLFKEAGVPDSGCYLNKSQVAKHLGVTVRTVNSFMKRGLLVYYKIGRTVRFKLEDVEKHFKASCRIGARGTPCFVGIPTPHLDRSVEFRKSWALDDARLDRWMSDLADNALRLHASGGRG